MFICKLPKKLKPRRTTAESINRLWLAITVVTCVLLWRNTIVDATALLQSAPHESLYSTETKKLMKATNIVTANTRVTVEANHHPTGADDNTMRRALETNDHGNVAKLPAAQLFHNELSVMPSNRVTSWSRGRRMVRDTDMQNEPPKRRRGRPRGRKPPDLNKPKRPRGRPRGRKTPDLNKPKRPRGRPLGRKTSNLNKRKKPQGRPRGRKPPDPNKPKRPQGRPRGRKPPDPNKPKRPQGRPRKYNYGDVQTITPGPDEKSDKRTPPHLETVDNDASGTQLPDTQLFRSFLSVVQPDHITSGRSSNRAIRDKRAPLDDLQQNPRKLRKRRSREKYDDDDKWTSNKPKWDKKQKHGQPFNTAKPSRKSRKLSRRGGRDETRTRRPGSFKDHDDPVGANRRRGPGSFKNRDGPAGANRRRGPGSFKNRDGPAGANRRRGPGSFKNRDGPASANRRRGPGSFKNSDSSTDTDRRRGPGSFKNRDDPASANRRRGPGSFKNRDGPASANRRRGPGSFKNRDGRTNANRKQGPGSFKNRDSSTDADRKRGPGSFKNRDGRASANRRRGLGSSKNHDDPADANRRRDPGSFKNRHGPPGSNQRQGPGSFKKRYGPARANRRRGQGSSKNSDDLASPTARRSRERGKPRTREELSKRHDRASDAGQKRGAESFKNRDRSTATGATNRELKPKKQRAPKDRPETSGTQSPESIRKRDRRSDTEWKPKKADKAYYDGSSATEPTQIYSEVHSVESTPTRRPGSFRPELTHGKDEIWMPDPPFSLYHPRNYGMEPPRSDPRVPKPVKNPHNSWIIEKPEAYHILEREIPHWRPTTKDPVGYDDITELTLKPASMDVPRKRKKRAVVSVKPKLRQKNKQQKNKWKQKPSKIRSTKNSLQKQHTQVSLLQQRRLLKKQRRRKIGKRRETVYYLGKARDVKDMLNKTKKKS